MTLEEMQDAKAVRPKPTGFPSYNGRRISEEALAHIWKDKVKKREVKAPRTGCTLQPGTFQAEVYECLTPIVTTKVDVIMGKTGGTAKQVRAALYNMKSKGFVKSISERVSRSTVTRWGRV